MLSQKQNVTETRRISTSLSDAPVTAPKMSICLPVYNQSQLVSECLDRILLHPGNEIEIVVNDDNSTEDILRVVNNKADSRIRYYHNERNLGHDLNIISSFRNAKAKFAFLLRTRDYILADSIPLILDRLEQNENTAYLTGTAINQDGKVKLRFTDGRVMAGIDAVKRDTELYIHPSGSVYAIELLDLDRLECAIRKTQIEKFSFVCHTMMRAQLALAGDFEFIQKPIWVYTDTEKAIDKAVNATTDRSSVYSPMLSRQRYECEFQWIDTIMPQKHKDISMRALFSRYLQICTWSFQRINKSAELQAHYSFDEVRFSLLHEQWKLVLLARNLMKKSSVVGCYKLKCLCYIYAMALHNVTVRPIVQQAVRFYGGIAHMIKEIFPFVAVAINSIKHRRENL